MRLSTAPISILTIYKISLLFIRYMMNYPISKYLFPLWLAFAFSACSSESGCPDEITPDYGDDVIRFSAPVISMDAPEVSTRATLLNQVTENTTFGVFGYCVPYAINGNNQPSWGDATTEWVGKKEHSHADVMYNEPIFYDGAKCVYTKHAGDNTLPKRWYTKADLPEGTPSANLRFEQFLYTFIAYHPYAANASDGFSIVPGDKTTRGIPKLTYTMPYAESSSLNNELDIEAAKDVMWALKADHMPGSGAVELEFRHVLTGLRLQVNNYNPTNDAEDNTVTIHSIAMEGHFYHSATIDFAPAIPVMKVNDDRYSGTFHFLKDDANLKLAPTSSRLIGTPEKADGTTILLLPNADASASGVNDAVPYLGTDKTITVTYTYHGTRTTKHVRNFSLGRIPEQGICYTLNLNFVGDQLLLMFTADSIEYWEPGSNNDIIIN